MRAPRLAFMPLLHIYILIILNLIFHERVIYGRVIADTQIGSACIQKRIPMPLQICTNSQMSQNNNNESEEQRPAAELVSPGTIPTIRRSQRLIARTAPIGIGPPDAGYPSADEGIAESTRRLSPGNFTPPTSREPSPSRVSNLQIVQHPQQQFVPYPSIAPQTYSFEYDDDDMAPSLPPAGTLANSLGTITPLRGWTITNVLDFQQVLANQLAQQPCGEGPM